MTVAISENVANIYERAGEVSVTHSLQGMGLHDDGDFGLAESRSVPEPPGFVPTHLFKRDALGAAMRSLGDRGIDWEVSEYGAFPQHRTGGPEANRDRLFRELKERTRYVDNLSRSGRLA